MNTEDRKGFFRFLFDGPDPFDKQKIEKRDKLIEILDFTMGEELLVIYSEIEKDWGNH